MRNYLSIGPTVANSSCTQNPASKYCPNLGAVPSVWPDIGVKIYPICFQKLPKDMPQQFLHKAILFKIAQNVKNSFGLLLKANFLRRTLKNHPIWAHWEPSFAAKKSFAVLSSLLSVAVVFEGPDARGVSHHVRDVALLVDRVKQVWKRSWSKSNITLYWTRISQDMSNRKEANKMETKTCRKYSDVGSWVSLVLCNRI